MKDDDMWLSLRKWTFQNLSQKMSGKFYNSKEFAICQRTSMAGLSLGNLFKVLKKLNKDLKFDTPDPKGIDN